MPVLLILAGGVIVYLLLQQGGVTGTYTNPYGYQRSLSIAPGGQQYSSPLYANPTSGLGAQGSGALTGTVVAAGAGSISQAILQSSANNNGGTPTGTASAVAGALGVVGGIFSALWSAHEARVKAATSENQAVNAAVAGWDSAMRQINAAYNSGAATPQQCIAAVQQAMANFWAEVGPVIQSGRNGCSSGMACPPYAGCSGSIGAACCVGCYDLEGDTKPATLQTSDGGFGTPILFGSKGTVVAISQGGGVVAYQAVYGSKYGGVNRPGYNMTWQHAA